MLLDPLSLVVVAGTELRKVTITDKEKRTLAVYAPLSLTPILH